MGISNMKHFAFYLEETIYLASTFLSKLDFSKSVVHMYICSMFLEFSSDISHLVKLLT